MFSVAICGITGPSFWRDEAATLSAVRRPLPRLWYFLGRTDVVHGLYYLMMLPVARVLGTGELAMRLPSAVAVAAAAGGTAAVGARLVSERAGLAAGLMFVAFPVTSRYGQEARSYAIVMALAVLSGYLLCRALGEGAGEGAGEGRHKWWAAYAAALAALGWMNLMALTLLPAHAVTVAGLGRGSKERARGLGAWAIPAAAAVLAVSPLLVAAWSQRGGTARFLAFTSASAVADAPERLTGSWLVFPLALLMVALTLRPGAAPAGVGWLCLPWLLAPPSLLLAAGAFSPLYDSRYTLFCVPALALLAGIGLDSLAGPAEPAR
jgi:mannosyltransferase